MSMFAPPVFTKTELLQIIQSAQTLKLDGATDIIPTKSGDGVCSRRSLVDGVKKVVETKEDRIGFVDLAKLLDVDDRYVPDILAGMTKDEWGVNGRQLVPTRPFAILENELRGELEKGVVGAVKYCRERDIQLDFLKRLLEYLEHEWSITTSWTSGDRYVYSNKFFEGLVDKVKVSIEDVTEPTELAEVQLLKEPGYPAEFVHQAIKRVISDGLWAGATGQLFVPREWVVRKQDEAVDTLTKEGVVATKTLKKAYFDKPDTFLADRMVEDGTTTILLSHHYVTQTWMDTIFAAALKSLDEYGFADFRSLASKLTEDEQGHIRDLFVKKYKQSRKLIRHADHLVTQELVDELLRISLVYAAEEAEKAWEAILKGTKSVLPAGPEWGSFLQWLVLDHREVPFTATQSIGKTILPKASTRYTGRLEELRVAANTSAKLHFVDKVYLRFLVNMTAVVRLQDAGLQEKLAQDLVAYYHRILIDGLNKLLDRVYDIQSQRKNERVEDAIKSINGVFESKTGPIRGLEALEAAEKELVGLIRDLDIVNGVPTPEIIKEKKAEMQRELKAQLEKATDVSLLMLIVLILLFSESEDGILRATGKYAPKLLKLIKPKLPEADYEFLNSIKAAVISKSSLPENDIGRLRQIGLMCGPS